MKAQSRKKSATTGATASDRLHRILVPVDFSEPSRQALRYAAWLAKEFGAKITLLYVVEPVASPDFAASFPLAVDQREMTELARRRLTELGENEIGEPAFGEVLVRTGKAYVEISKAARAARSDLIVIATHGYTGLKRAFLGSTAERVVREAPCPVLTIRDVEHGRE